MNDTYWIWYPGDFEIYHGMMQNFSREERGFRWPAYWYIDDCRKNVRFFKTYELLQDETFTVYSNSMGYVKVNGEKHLFGKEIVCKKGAVAIEVFTGAPTGIPAIFVTGKTIKSDKSWQVEDFTGKPVNVGWNKIYRDPRQNPSIWEYSKRKVCPAHVYEKCGGTLYDFETELNGKLNITFQNGFKSILICYGESEMEALDKENCYYSQTLTREDDDILLRAFRYIFIPDIKPQDIELQATEYYVDIPSKAFFTCEDEEINRIWKVAERTFQLCSGIFFIDGIKRDRWIWSGDAYQSYFVNQYLMFDEDINKRTILALRGNDPVRQHINTIVDYSMYWIISIYNHYRMTGDMEFVQMVYPKMLTMMEFLESQLDENGFIVGRKGDWIFIDWGDMDKDGPVCAEQILLAMCYKTMATLGNMMDAKNNSYQDKYDKLAKQINHFYWDKEKKAYIDCFSSGKRHISRQSNIFALLFDIADKDKRQDIFEHVLMNDEVPAITTPYFKFYELEVLCRMGRKEEVKKIIKDYWGGMLKRGAVTFWEEYDPKKKDKEQYEMYGDPFGKSLCHAWAGSPIYLIGRYFMGICPLEAGYKSFVIEPDFSLFKKVDCQFPVKDGMIDIKWNGSELRIKTTKPGGILKFMGDSIRLESNQEYILPSK